MKSKKDRKMSPEEITKSIESKISSKIDQYTYKVLHEVIVASIPNMINIINQFDNVTDRLIRKTVGIIIDTVHEGLLIEAEIADNQK